MSSPRRFIQEIHRRSLWQVLAIYLVGAWVGYEVIQSLTEGLGLPAWFPPFAILLFIVGLPIVLATAFVQEGLSTRTRADPTLLPDADVGAAGGPHEVGGVRTLFTWRNAIMGGVLAFALWGLIAAGWLVFTGKPDEASVGSAPGRKMLVVLPFENLGAPDDEYFADGITEEITSRLAEIGGLGIIARTSAGQYKGTEKTIEQIGEDLGVQYVLEGTVRWEKPGEGESRVRVTPQLIRVSDATHLWTERYDAVLAGVFQIQSEIAEEVAQALDITLLEPERLALKAKPTENLAAYDSYLRGKDYYNRGGTANDFRLAEALFDNAVRLDPNFAPAQARRSRAHVRYLAQIYVMIGHYDDAIDQLEWLVSEGEISIPLLQDDPAWDPLRDHPRFQKLLQGEP